MENNEKNKLAKSYREFLSNIRPTNLSAQTVSEKFYLPYGSNSVPNIQDYFEYIIKIHDNFADIPPLQIYTNKTENRITLINKTG